MWVVKDGLYFLVLFPLSLVKGTLGTGTITTLLQKGLGNQVPVTRLLYTAPRFRSDYP